MDFLTTKQWFFLSCVSYGLIVYFGFKILHFQKEARIERTLLAKMIVKLGKAIGHDLTKED